MLSNKCKKQDLLLAAAALVLISVGFFIYPNVVISIEIDRCNADADASESKKIDCWYEIIRETFNTKGTEEAFDIFEDIYTKYDVFTNTGCHRHAHRVGDMSYYLDYLTHKDLTQMDFPKNANLCGYGFYHGFVEHLIQDNPDTNFTVKACTQLIESLESVAPAIQQTCYHGAGHGFLLAKVDQLSEGEGWSRRMFIEEPLSNCEALTSVTQNDRNECRQGVYNVFTDWMSYGEYGLSFNTEEPFDFCNAEHVERREDCYYEVAQKLDMITDSNPIEMGRLIQVIEDEDVRGSVLGTGIAGIIQNNPAGNQYDVLTQCQSLSEDLVVPCIKGIVGGLIEHDISKTNYTNAANFCAYAPMSDAERNECLIRGVDQMQRFRTPNELQKLCAQKVYPDTFCATVENRIRK